MPTLRIEVSQLERQISGHDTWWIRLEVKTDRGPERFGVLVPGEVFRDHAGLDPHDPALWVAAATWGARRIKELVDEGEPGGGQLLMHSKAELDEMLKLTQGWPALEVGAEVSPL